jgi:hypothetical protein
MDGASGGMLRCGTEYNFGGVATATRFGALLYLGAAL